MNVGITAGLIALGGVLASVIASVALALRATRIELEKTRQQLTSAYATRLIDARLPVYPKLYAFLSDFIKHIEGGSDKHMAGQALTIADLRDMLSKLVVWDSQHALLISDHAGRASFGFRQQLIQLIRAAQSNDEGTLTSMEILRSLLVGAQQLEIALKVDLGIYEIEMYEGRDFYESYLKASQSVESQQARE